MKYFLLVLFSIGCFFTNAFICIAQPNYPPPSGVWCSCPPSTGIGSGSVVPAVATKSYVNGILIRVVWKDIETADNVYNWALIDNQIAAAESYGKKIALAVGTGPNSPDWLYNLGASSMSFTLPFSGTIPVPWNSVFLTKWKEFIAELGDRYENNTTIQLVYMTNSSTNGFEMQLPYMPTPSYATLGYTDQLVIDSWEDVIDEYNSAFPNHYLTNDFHPVNTSDAVANSLYSYAKLNIGSRYGANAWWWTQNNTTVYPSQYTILQNSTTENNFTGIQMAASGESNPSAFGTGGMPAALNLAISNNVCYWEIWNNDITSGNFDSILSTATCTTLNTNETALIKKEITIFPNPSQGIFQIKLENNTLKKIEVYNTIGQLILLKNKLSETTCEVNLINNSNGFYFLKIQDHSGAITIKKIILSK